MSKLEWDEIKGWYVVDDEPKIPIDTNPNYDDIVRKSIVRDSWNRHGEGFD